MKKFCVIAMLAATLAGNVGFAQSNNKNMGKGAAAAKNSGSDGFAWGIALGALAVLGVVVVLTAGSASSSPSSYSHS